MNYFNLDELDKQEIPKKYGYEAKLIKDEINNIGFYKLVKTQELIEIESLKQKLAYTDYKAIKYAEGQLSEEEYTSIKAERQAWRNKINELEIKLSKEGE